MLPTSRLRLIELKICKTFLWSLVWLCVLRKLMVYVSWIHLRYIQFNSVLSLRFSLSSHPRTIMSTWSQNGRISKRCWLLVMMIVVKTILRQTQSRKQIRHRQCRPVKQQQCRSFKQQYQVLQLPYLPILMHISPTWLRVKTQVILHLHSSYCLIAQHKNDNLWLLATWLNNCVYSWVVRNRFADRFQFVTLHLVSQLFCTCILNALQCVLFFF